MANEVSCGIINDEDMESYKIPFERYCPVHMKIDSLMYIKCTEQPVCRWLVFYKSDIRDCLEEREDLKTQTELIMRQHPINCVVLGKNLVPNDRIIIQYGVVCFCTVPVFDLKEMRNPSFLEKLRYLSLSDATEECELPVAEEGGNDDPNSFSFDEGNQEDGSVIAKSGCSTQM